MRTLITIIALIAVLAIAMLMTRAIVNSDMPLWLKIFLLRK